MTPLFRVMPLLLAATALSSCATGLGLEEEATSPYGAFLAARYAGVNRDAQGAAIYYAEALDRLPGNAVLTDRAFITAVIAGEMSEASDLAAETVAAGDPSRLATLYLAADEIAGRRYRRAVDVLDASPDFGPFNAFVGDMLSHWALLGAGRADEAVARADETVAPGFLAPHFWLHKAMLLDAAGRVEAADEAYRSAVFATTFPRLATELYGEFLERNGRRDAARALYETQLINDPDEASILAALARVETGARAPRPRSIPELAARSVLGPSASLAANADMDLTVIYLRMVQRLDPAYPPTRMTLGETLQRINLPEAALREYEAVGEGPFRLAAEVDRIWLLGRLSRIEDATNLARQLVAETGDYEARLILADLLRVQGGCSEAAGVYRAVIESKRAAGLPDDWRYHYYRAACLVETGNWPDAEAEYLAALELAPDESRILNDLGYLWIERGEHTDRAVAMIQDAARLDPDDGNVIDSLGWAHYQLGQYETAVLELERATELDPGNVAANLHLGDAYWQVGRRLEAGFQWRRALDLEPRDEQRMALEYRLEYGRPPVHEPLMADNSGVETEADLRTADGEAGEP